MNKVTPMQFNPALFIQDSDILKEPKKELSIEEKLNLIEKKIDSLNNKLAFIFGEHIFIKNQLVNLKDIL